MTNLTKEDRERIKLARSEHRKKEIMENKTSDGRSIPYTINHTDEVRKRIESAARTGRIPQHGTENEYSNYGCRCGPCRRIHSVKMRELFWRPCVEGCGNMAWHHSDRSGRCRSCAQKARVKTVKHGSENMYRHRGCRCVVCRGAASKRRRNRPSRANRNT